MLLKRLLPFRPTAGLNRADAPRALVAAPRAAVAAPRVLRREGNLASGNTVHWSGEIECNFIDLGVNDKGLPVACFKCERARERCRCSRSRPSDVIQGLRVVVAHAVRNEPSESVAADPPRRTQRERCPRTVEAASQDPLEVEATAPAVDDSADILADVVHNPQFEQAEDELEGCADCEAEEHVPPIEQAEDPSKFEAGEPIEEDVNEDEAVSAPRVLRREGNLASGNTVHWSGEIECNFIDLGVNDKGLPVACFKCERARERCRCSRSRPSDVIQGLRVVVAHAVRNEPSESVAADPPRRTQRERCPRTVEAASQDPLEVEATAPAVDDSADILADVVHNPQFEQAEDELEGCADCEAEEHVPPIEQAEDPSKFEAGEPIEEDVNEDEAVSHRRNVRMLKVCFLSPYP